MFSQDFMAKETTQTAYPLSSSSSDQQESVPKWLSVVRAKMDGLRFGVVQIVVHDGRVTQIERTEKIRLDL